jgi:hypothetical protein
VAVRLFHVLLARNYARFDNAARRHGSLACLLASMLAVASCADRADDEALCSALAQHHLAHFYAANVPLACPNVSAEAPSAELRASLRGEDAGALRKALALPKARALAIKRAPAKGKTMAERLAGLLFVSGLRAVALSSELALYAPVREPDLNAREREGLAYVARALLRGAREPSMNSFPPALRRVERVEVMVLLRERGTARLWRSARGTSIARALVTATRVARDRWRERESAMGGPLHERLLDLDVEISLLSEDGVIVGPTNSLVDAAVGPEHGIGFEYKSGWHYLLPEDLQRRARGSAHRALLSLMSEQAVPSTALAAGALRVYRFVTLTLGTSRAPLAGASPG